MKYKNTNYSKNNKKNIKNEVVNTKPSEETTSKKNVNENYHIAENKSEECINQQNRKKETISTEKQPGKTKNLKPPTEEPKKDDKGFNSFNLDELKSIIY